MSGSNPRSAVRANVNEARLARQWDRIAARLDTPRRRVRWPVVAVGVALVGVVAALLWVRIGTSESAAAWDGAVLETASAGMAVSLRDGSRIELDPRTKVSVETSGLHTALALERGGASFDVVHVAGRRFRVSLAGVEVRVIGTRFSVREVTGASGVRQVEVHVTRGAVEASAGASAVRLSAGQTWSVPLPSSRQQTAPNRVPPPAASVAPAPQKQGDSTAEPTPAVAAAEPLRGRSAPEASAPLDKADAKTLFETANRARAAGNAAGAAEGYRSLLEAYPRDARAALAAFELGRLQMDRLGQPAQAIASFQRALASSAGGGFREDAMARLVTAYSATGARAACLRARAAYLKQYPNGVHRSTVQTQCGASGSP